MKPQKLVMSAFGSYATETVIDFSDKNHGVFLITGDTGAGKTTIFDAIVYALYDRTSGGARETYDMRSQYADPDTPTFVEYTFTYGNDTYKIRRNPKYTRPGRRRNKDGTYKETTEQPGAELTLPDGRVFPGRIKETNEKIVEIIGLDESQFTQVAMIAQGQFMQLLRASSASRKEIFAKLFHTGSYAGLQEELRKKTRSLQEELDNNKKLCEQEIAGIRASDGVLFSFLEHDLQEVLHSLKELLEKDRKKEREQQELLEQTRRRIEEKSGSLASAKQTEELFAHLESAGREAERLQKLSAGIKEKEGRLVQAKKALLVKQEEEKYQKGSLLLKEGEKRLHSFYHTLQEITDELEQCAKEQLLAAKEKEEKEPQYREQLLRIRASLPMYEQVQSLEAEQKERTGQLLLLKEQETEKRQLLENAQEELVRLHEKTQQALQAYQQANDDFIAQQAGLMAQSLQEGMRCPVCGSTSHPKKAELSKCHVTQQQVKTAKQEWQTADGNVQHCSDRITALREAAQELREKAQEQSMQTKTVRRKQEELRAQLLFTDKDEAQRELDALQKRLEQALAFAKQTEEKYQRCEKKKLQLLGEITAEEEQKKRLQKEEAALFSAFEKALLQQGFSSVEAYREAALEEAQITALEQEKTAYREDSIRNKETLRQLQKQTEGKERTDIGQLSQELSTLQKERERLESENRELYGVRQRNQEAYEKLQKAFAKREELKKQYQLYATLDKTANGSLSGTAKLDFQTYIQRRFFEKIIHEANKRLIKMTSGQFLLQCRSLDRLGSQGAVGLDLDVYSLVNDRTRDVKTLSGGESFLAALAMALGMADVIQNTAGSVQLETMFIDEGFGSLDDEAREEAVKILQELAGDRRLVGIISHVTELKEQIDCKLVITKDERGSRAVWS